MKRIKYLLCVSPDIVIDGLIEVLLKVLMHLDIVLRSHYIEVIHPIKLQRQQVFLTAFLPSPVISASSAPFELLLRTYSAQKLGASHLFNLVLINSFASLSFRGIKQ